MLAFIVLAGISARAEIINFDNLPGMTFWAGNPVPTESQLSNQLAHLGVKFSSTAPYCAVVNLGTMATSEPNGIAGASAQGLLSYAEVNPVVITFCYPGRPETQGITDSVRIRGDRGYTGGGGRGYESMTFTDRWLRRVTCPIPVSPTSR